MTHSRNNISLQKSFLKKSFPDKEELKEFIATRPTLQEMLKEVFKVEVKEQEMKCKLKRK